ncbi:MAG: tRNA (adenosine(37)-N6)-dimethylallyltransferase MiaA [bacterium]|nr:tRNA (adenosine(37)-N6)-dimethylallyltransferase MiaA [bacterium]
MKKQLPKIIVVCGPTATGKSDLAVLLARELDAEIVSADSRQVYRGMDIGSGKITAREMKKIPHHLLDVADPRKARYTVDDFKRDGEAAVADILSRGRLPIICGGTGFYIDALVKGETYPDVPPNQTLRKQLANKTVVQLMAMIRKLDPRRAKTLDPFNKVRIIRAIEIAKTLGSIPKVRRAPKYNAFYIGLTLDKESLREKIHVRLIKRIKAGMVVEVAKLKTSGVSWKRLEAFGLEYRYVALYLQKKLTKDEMLAQLESEIVRYARRQMQWFTKNKGILWLSPAEKQKALISAKKYLRVSA